MLKKILSYILLIALSTGIFPMNSIFAAEDQILTAPSPTFVENQTQPITNFKLNRYLLGYNTDTSTSTYFEQAITLDRDSFGGISFRLSRINEIASDETPARLKLSILQKDDSGAIKTIAETIKPGVSSVSKTEVKWLFPNGIIIVPNREFTIKIEVLDPPLGTDKHTFSYYVYGTENVKNRPLYFGNLSFFDGIHKIKTSDILNLSILRADNNNLGVPIASPYKYPKLDSINNELLDASNFRVITDNSLQTSNLNTICNNGVTDSMTYRGLTGKEFENLLRHSQYFNVLMDKVQNTGNGGLPFPIATNSYSYISTTGIYQFQGMDINTIKNTRSYSKIDPNNSVGHKFTFCVYNKTDQIEGESKKVTTNKDQKIALSGLDYDTSLYLTNKTPTQKIIQLNANKAILNTLTKEFKGTALDTGINVQGGNIIKVYGKIAIDNNGFHDSNGYVNTDGEKQGIVVYKIGNSEWKEGGNIININDSGRLYLAITDNDNNLTNNLGSFKIAVDKVIITNSIRQNNNLYFNINKNITNYAITLGVTTDGSDFSQIYNSSFIPANNIKVKSLDFIYEKKIPELVNSKGIAFDGSYYYTVKGNKILKIGSGYNETKEYNITTYTITEDLSNILSIVAVKGDVYIGYSKNGLSNYISKVIFNGGGIATLKNVKVGEGGLLSNDLGNIQNKKIEKNRYLLTSDDRYIYNISYLAGTESEGNKQNKDQGYNIKIFDPANEMVLVKDIFVNPLLDKDGKVTNKIGYYTEGAFVDNNYIYIIETNTSNENSNVVILDKVTFKLEGKVSLKQYDSASQCSADSNSTNVYSCARTGVYDLMNNRLALLSSESGKIHFYNINVDNLVHYRIPKHVDLDNINQKKQFLIRYSYKYNKLLTTNTYISEKNGETISNNTKYVAKGYQLANDKITAVISDVIRNTDNDKLYKEYNGIVKLTRNEGNSSSIRKESRGFNYSSLKVNNILQKWRSDYGTISGVRDHGYIIKGERDSKGIVPSIRYELGEDNEFLRVILSIRNDSSVILNENRVEYSMNLGGSYEFTDNRGATGSGIGEGANKYVFADDLGTDDGFFFAVADSSNQRIGVSAGTLNNVKLLVKRVTLQPGEERNFDFFIGSKLDTEDSTDYMSKVTNSSSFIMPYSISDYDSINKKLLNTSISKSERVIKAPQIGVDPGYTYESDNVDIVIPFDETWDADRVSGGKPLSGNGWWSDNFSESGGTMKSTISGSGGNGKIATLELVKYIPSDTTISFDIKGQVVGPVKFLLDDTQYNIRNSLNQTITKNIPKGLHIFTWKYSKNSSAGGNGDYISLDNIKIGKTLDVFASDCPYAGAALFYTTSYYNNFSNLETSSGESHSYSIHSDAGHGLKNKVNTYTQSLDDGGSGRRGSSSSRPSTHAWYIEQYGAGQVLQANMYTNDGKETNRLYYDIKHPNGSGKIKFMFDGIYGPGYYGEDAFDLRKDGTRIGIGSGNGGGGYPILINREWNTIINNDDYSGNSSHVYRFGYGETDGGDDGATYLDNFIMKIKDPKTGCQMPAKSYNDKLGTHFIIPGYNMQTSTDRSKDIPGVVELLSIEPDTFIEVQEINASTGANIGTKQVLYNEKVGESLKLNVKQGSNYDIIANKNISVLINNFYPDLSRTGDTSNDNTPTYDMQNGNDFIIQLPGNKYKKGNLYISHYEDKKNTTVHITDITNNKTNFNIILKADDSTAMSSTDENDKPYRSLTGIGEGQILHITSDNPITIYYGLGNKPAIAELLSPNAQTFYYPILADTANVVDYNSQMYTYYDMNLASIRDSKGGVIISKQLDIGDNVSASATNANQVGTWFKAVGTGPVGLAVGNKSSSFDYLYPLKSSKKLYGIGNQYLFNNVNATKLIIIADSNNGNDVTFNIKDGNGTSVTKTLKPKQTLIYDMQPNTSYDVETTDNKDNLYIYAQKGDNVRNTFTTAFKSRENIQLGDKIIKNDIGEKYLKYKITGDFDFLVDEPIKVGNININSAEYKNGNADGNITNIPVDKNEKLVVNGAWSYADPTPTDLNIDKFKTGRYVNGIYYKTLKNVNYNNGLFYKTTTDDTLHYLGGGLINKNDWNLFKVGVQDSHYSDNGPNVIYKIYGANTYFPDIRWASLYDYIKPTGNTLDISLDGTVYFAKRNLSDKTFDMSFNNGIISTKTNALSTEFTDTYYVPVIRKINNDTVDYVELNKITTFQFDRTGSDLGVICIAVEDNNTTKKDICYTNALNEKVLRTDLTNFGRIKHINNDLTTHVRNIYSDYIEIFNDGTKPMKFLGVEFTGIKKNDATTTFSNVKVKNFTDVNPELFFKPNINIYSEDTPLSHSLKVGKLNITRGTILLKPQTDTLTIKKDASNKDMNSIDTSKAVSFDYNGLNYKANYIVDNDELNDDMEESIYNAGRLYPLEEKNDYIIFFRARGKGMKEIQLINEDDTHTYIDTIFTPRQYTGNKLSDTNSLDIGDLYKIRFKTDWGDNENVKIKLINHNGDLFITDVRILKLDDSDFKLTEKVLQGDGSYKNVALPNTGKLPVMLAKNKKGTTKGEIVHKMITYYNYSNNNWIGHINNITDLETALTGYDSNTDLDKAYTYSADKNILNLVDGNPYTGVSVSKMTTNVVTNKDIVKKVRIGMVGAIKVNGNYIYKNLYSEKEGCVPGSGTYTNYDTDNIKEDNCLVNFYLTEGINTIEMYSIVNNPNYKVKGIYKDTSFNIPIEKIGNTNNELLTYGVTPGMPVKVQSFIPLNTTLSNAVNIEGQSMNVGIIGKNIEVLSVQNIDRDYAIKETPYILNTFSNRNVDKKDINRLVEIGLGKKVNITSGTRNNDYITSGGYVLNQVKTISMTKKDVIGLNTNDILEVLVKFPHLPKQFNIKLTNSSNEKQNIFWGDNYIFNEEVDGKRIIKVGSLDGLESNKWYKIYIPIKGTILENTNLKGLDFKTFDGDMGISEITVLQNKLINNGNNLRVTFDVDILSDTQKRDIIFGLTNNSTLLKNQGYEINFSKNSSTTELKKNGTVIASVTNDNSFIKDGVDKYRIMFVKNKNKLYVSVKYNYTDPTDGIFKTKVDNIISVEDTSPLNLKNSQLIFKNNKNKYKVSNIRIEDGEDNERISFVHLDSLNQHYSNGKLYLYNNLGDVDEKDFQLYGNIEDSYINISNMSSYKGIITDVVVKPNILDTNTSYNIKKLDLIKESETPSIISGNNNIDILGITKIKKGSSVSEVFTNDKEYIMGFTVFVAKVTSQIQPEGLTLKLYEADSSGQPKLNASGEKVVLAEKNVNTDSVDIYPNVTPLKIVFPQIAVVDGQDYVFELSTTNDQGLYIYGTQNNTYTQGYATNTKIETPFAESFEFNNFGDRVYGSKGSVGYFGSTLGATNVPNREIISGENLQVTGTKSKHSTITIKHNDNQNIYNKATFIIKGYFPKGNSSSWPLIIQKQSGANRTYGVYINRNTSKLHFSFRQQGMSANTSIVTGTEFSEENVIIGISIDTTEGFISIYKNGNLTDKFELGVPVSQAVIVGTGEVGSNWEDVSLKGIPFTKTNADLTIMGQHNGWDSNTMKIDFIRLYDSALTQSQIIAGSKSLNKYTYRLPYDIAFYMISKSNDIETLEERTYDLGDGTIHEVSGDLILNGYDAGDGISRVILKGNSTFRVKGDIIINADEVLVINDNSKEGNDALSYIGFITDNDIIIGKNVKFMQGGYFAKHSIKTELSRLQLKVNGLLSGNSIDLQNRTYLQQGKICSTNEKENCSVILEFDKRLYKRMPPLFYQNNDKSGVTITEE